MKDTPLQPSESGDSRSQPSPRWLGFWNMLYQQTQNAFHDKAAQFLLIPLGAAVGHSIETQAVLIFAVPYVLFAPLAGWASDRFSKRHVMLVISAVHVSILVWLCFAVKWRSMDLALLGFFALAVQSTFFGPAKIGISKELVGSRHLGFASGIQQMATILAFLGGQIAAGRIFDWRYSTLGGEPSVAWSSAQIPMIVLAVTALPTVLLAWLLPRVPAQGGKRLTPGVMVQHFRDLKDLWADRGLRRASFGVAFFWGFAAFINLWSLKLAKEITMGQAGFGTLSSVFMTAASLGMAAGFGTAAFLLRKRIELGWVPVAGVLMAITALVLAFLAPGGWVFLVSLGLLAFLAAVFLAPLIAWMQDRYPAAKRGELQASVNLQDCLAGIVAVILTILSTLILSSLGVAPMMIFRLQMIAVAVACAFTTWYIIRLLPRHFLRIIFLGIVRLIYHVRAVNADRVPMTGGVLLLPNHVTFADAFFISAACPRPVRFVMDEGFMAERAVAWFCTVFETVTIRRDQPREAIRITIEALKNGDAVCFFPEGQLTRTGALLELKRGVELIAKKSGAPCVPLWMDGAWGSIFSYERNRFFGKLPYKIPHSLVASFGEIIPPTEVTLETLRAGILKASADALRKRFPEASSEKINGYQIGQVNALQRKATFAALDSEPLVEELPSLFFEFPMRYSCARHGWGVLSSYGPPWVGGGMLRSLIEKSQEPPGTARHIDFYDFSDKAATPLETPNVLHFPCLAIEGRVISMSMPDPPPTPKVNEFQPGNKPGTYGKLLPGWYLETAADGSLFAKGPAADEAGLKLPDGCFLDADGFLALRR